MEMRKCRVCGEDKEIARFPETKSEGNGRKYRRHECRHCTYLRQESWRVKNRDRLRQKGAENMQKWRESLSPEAFREYRANATERSKQRHARLKEAVYQAYGGYVCRCCGETEPLFLSLDHVNNDGYQHRKKGKAGSGARIYNWLWSEFKKTGQWPTGFQILCMNCQHGKSRNKGICPHSFLKV